MILVVDDNQPLCEALADFLSSKGHTVKCSANGAEALRWIADTATRPAVILLDLMMPVLDGWGVLAELRKDPELGAIPVIITSALHDIADRAMESGAMAVLRKPVEPGTLLRVIEQFTSGGARA